MAKKLSVTDLDFDDIKSNLKNFLRQQDQLSDYDFEVLFHMLNMLGTHQEVQHHLLRF